MAKNKIEIKERIALSVAEAAAMLGVSEPTAYNMVRIEGFPAKKVNGRWLVSRKGLEEWLQDNM